jgi:hypothetical protein
MAGTQPALPGIVGAFNPPTGTQGDARRELSTDAETICAIHERLGGTVRIVRRGRNVRCILDGVERTMLDASEHMALRRKAT